jgi:HEPN domain-containing protein
MNRSDLQRLAEMRLREAEALLGAGCYEGAYYLAGYAVECALKACIAKQTREHDFPDKQRVLDSYTHDLGKLFRVAKHWKAFQQLVQEDRDIAAHWTLLRKWSVSDRYAVSVDRDAAASLIAAISDQDKGILPWLKTLW